MAFGSPLLKYEILDSLSLSIITIERLLDMVLW